MRDTKVKILLILLIILANFSCNKGKKISKNNEKKKQEQSKIIIDKFSFTDSSKGKLNWILNSNRAIIDNNKKIINLIGVKIKYKNKYLIISPKGKYLMNKKIVKLFNVVKIYSDNTTFLTKNLTFYGKINKIKTDEKIKITNPQFKVTANALIGYIGENRYILRGSVRSILR